MIDYPSVVFYALGMRMLTLLSIDEISLPRHSKWPFDFRGLSLKVEMAPSYLKHMNFSLFEFMQRPIRLAACSRLCSRDSCFQVYFLNALDFCSLHLS